MTSAVNRTTCPDSAISSSNINCRPRRSCKLGSSSACATRRAMSTRSGYCADTREFWTSPTASPATSRTTPNNSPKLPIRIRNRSANSARSVSFCSYCRFKSALRRCSAPNSRSTASNMRCRSSLASRKRSTRARFRREPSSASTRMNSNSCSTVSGSSAGAAGSISSWALGTAASSSIATIAPTLPVIRLPAGRRWAARECLAARGPGLCVFPV